MSGTKKTRQQADSKKAEKEVLSKVLEELRHLREEVKTLKEKQSATSQPANESEASRSTPQVAASTEQAENQRAQPAFTISSALAANPLLLQGLGIGSHVATTSTPSAPVPSSSLPITDIVPENVRKDILAGKDVNLCTLLIPVRERGNFMIGRDITIGEQTLALKPLSDKRLSKLLTIQEFVKAFNICKNVICEAFPNRRVELDRYLTSLIDISARYQGFAHYEYHLEFSARAAFYRQHHNIMIDWGSIDERLLTQIVAGRKANNCSLCGGYDHATTFCQLAADSNPEKPGEGARSRPCLFFNKAGGCRSAACSYPHKCSRCLSSNHTAMTCGTTKITRT
jgi:hypothetical protein